MNQRRIAHRFAREHSNSRGTFPHKADAAVAMRRAGDGESDPHRRIKFPDLAAPSGDGPEAVA